jgi:transposase
VIGLPSLRAFDHQHSARIWLAAAPVDMRCGFDRLAELARAVTGQDPFHAHLFLFRSRRGDRLKVLQWDRDGYVLWYKRLEVGVFRLPQIRSGASSIELRPSEFAMLLDGIDMSRVKRMPRYERVACEVDKRCMIAG